MPQQQQQEQQQQHATLADLPTVICDPWACATRYKSVNKVISASGHNHTEHEVDVASSQPQAQVQVEVAAQWGEHCLVSNKSSNLQI